MDGHPFSYFRSAPNLTCPCMGLAIITFSSTVFIGNYGYDKSRAWEEKLYVYMDNASRCSRVLMPWDHCFEQKDNVEYIDKTKNGGSLYFYDSQVADNLKKRGYIVLYAKYGTKGTQFRPAWYIPPQ